MLLTDLAFCSMKFFIYSCPSVPQMIMMLLGCTCIDNECLREGIPRSLMFGPFAPLIDRLNQWRTTADDNDTEKAAKSGQPDQIVASDLVEQ